MPRTGQRRATGRAALPLALLGVALAVLLPAPAASAAQDPTHPQATVTRGPSCAPGGLAVRVSAGTVGVHVVLATTRHPTGEDAADLPAGGATVLATGDVGWGETVDPRLLATPADGSGQVWVDELEDWTLTRPTEADCRVAAGELPALPAGPSAAVTEGAAGADGDASRAVGAGHPITVTARGFAPGEPVSARLHGAPAVLARGTAGVDGTVALRLTVPARAAGATGLEVSGAASGAARLELLVAAARQPGAAGRLLALPPVAALLGLAATGAALVEAARRSARLRRGAAPGGGPAPGGARWGGAPVGARDGAQHPR